MIQPVAAQPVQTSGPVVVELYTSQGCSACPPADEALRRLAARKDVLPLAFHVDYWDYIGWTDIFGAPEYTERQRGYAKVAGRRMVYTPQAIIMGQDDIIASDVMQLGEGIAAYTGRPYETAISATRDGDRLQVDLDAMKAAPDSPLRVQLIRYRPNARVEITRGELAGHTLHYVNVVESTQVLAEWNGAEPLSLNVDISGSLPGAILVQHWPFGAITAAARID